MGLLNELEWPDALVKALEAVIGRVSGDDLAGAAARVPEFEHGGFRVAGAKTETLQRRAVQLLRGTGPVPDSLRRLAQMHSLYGSVVALLSEEVLVRRWDELAACLGAAPLVLGMLLDPREKVRKAAADRAAAVGEPVGAQPMDRTQAAIQAVFGGLLGELVPVLERAAQGEGDGAEGFSTATDAELRARNARQQEELTAARKQAARVAGLEAKVARLETAIQEARRETQQWRTVAEERAREVAAARGDGVRWRDEAAALVRSADARVAAEVASQLDGEAMAWLRGPRAADAVATETAGSDVAARARALLERQSTVDRHAGTLSGLRRRLVELSSLRGQVRQAQADALNPLPELRTVEAALGAEMAKIERIVGGEGCRGSAAEALLARFATSEEAELETVGAVLDQMERLGLLSEHEREELQAARRNRLAQRIAVARVRDEGATGAESGDGLSRLWRKLGGTRGTELLLVDGYNVLLGLETRYGGCNEPAGRPGERARVALLRDVAVLVSAVAECEARVYFDGPEEGETAFGLGVKVVFSGGSGTDRADHRIVGDLHFRTSQGSGPNGRGVLLVTDDRGLVQRAKSADGSVVRVTTAQFEDLIRLAAASRRRGLA